MFDFYSELSGLERKKYDNMLDTHFILLMCDLEGFREINEHGEEKTSFSWIYSLPNTLEKFGFEPYQYPKGSLSANRFYYEGLKNFCGGTFPSNNEFRLIREGIVQFLKLRRDDSKPINSKLFGSSFSIKESHSRENKPYREVDCNLRHSASALWVLCEESESPDSDLILESFRSFVNEINSFIDQKRTWEGDEFEHMTLASAIGLFKLSRQKSRLEDIKSLSDEMLAKCEKKLLENCLEQDIQGRTAFKLPKNRKMSDYEFFLSYFSLIQTTHLLYDSKIQSLIKRILDNAIETEAGLGIPTFNLWNYESMEEIVPDFGATSAILPILYHFVDQNIGSRQWVERCRIEFMRLLRFCLKTYALNDYYQLSLSENNSKILLLNNYNSNSEHIDHLLNIAHLIKLAIKETIISKKANIDKSLSSLKLPNDFGHLKALISNWNIQPELEYPKYASFNYAQAGEFAGGLIIGATKSLAN